MIIFQEMTSNMLNWLYSGRFDPKSFAKMGVLKRIPIFRLLIL